MLGAHVGPIIECTARGVAERVDNLPVARNAPDCFTLIQFDPGGSGVERYLTSSGHDLIAKRVDQMIDISCDIVTIQSDYWRGGIRAHLINPHGCLTDQVLHVDDARCMIQYDCLIVEELDGENTTWVNDLLF